MCIFSILSNSKADNRLLLANMLSNRSGSAAPVRGTGLRSSQGNLKVSPDPFDLFFPGKRSIMTK